MATDHRNRIIHAPAPGAHCDKSALVDGVGQLKNEAWTCEGDGENEKNAQNEGYKYCRENVRQTQASSEDMTQILPKEAKRDRVGPFHPKPKVSTSAYASVLNSVSLPSVEVNAAVALMCGVRALSTGRSGRECERENPFLDSASLILDGERLCM